MADNEESEEERTSGDGAKRVAWKKNLFSLFADPVKLLTQPIKLPGWAAIIFAIFVFFPDWHARVDFWLHVAKAAGGRVGLVAAAITSPYFSPALAFVGVLWILFVGEPKSVQRRHWLRYVGWSVFLICVTTVVLVGAYGAIEFYIQQQVSVRDHEIQEKSVVRPVFWHLTEGEKTSLGIALDQVPDSDRFELQIKCLPDAGSRAFVEEIGKIFIDHKWKIKANCFFSNTRPDLTGLYISLSKNLAGKPIQELPKNLATLLRIFDKAKTPGRGVAFDDLKDDEFYLVVGNAP
jgi:hypothetical protein